MFALKVTRVLPQTEVEALLARMRQRLYPETVPVLASYWLKTVYAGGHNRWWWKDLNEELKRALRAERLDERQRTALTDIQNWIHGAAILSGKTPESKPGPAQPFRPGLSPEHITLYIVRLLNEWLPAEVARMLADESEPGIPEETGAAVLSIGLALERILTREHLSPGSLEMLLQPELVSPHHVYALDLEILHDVVLSLLGRTSAPPLPVMPATILGVASRSPLPPEYPEAVRNAFLVESDGRQEVHVPLTEAQAEEVFQRAPLRTGSTLVTMDGRCWESESVEGGEQPAVIHRPIERLKIDFTAEHAMLEIPWPEAQLHWNGDFIFRVHWSSSAASGAFPGGRPTESLHGCIWRSLVCCRSLRLSLRKTPRTGDRERRPPIWRGPPWRTRSRLRLHFAARSRSR